MISKHQQVWVQFDVVSTVICYIQIEIALKTNLIDYQKHCRVHDRYVRQYTERRCLQNTRTIIKAVYTQIQ